MAEGHDGVWMLVTKTDSDPLEATLGTYDVLKKLYDIWVLNWSEIYLVRVEESPCLRELEAEYCPTPAGAPIRVVAALFTYGDRYVVMKRKHSRYDGCWEFPGGKVEPGETDEEALRREINEECGFTPTIGKLVASSGPLKNLQGVLFEIHLYSVLPGEDSGSFKFRVHSELRYMRPHEIIALPEDEVVPSLKPLTRLVFMGRMQKPWSPWK